MRWTNDHGTTAFIPSKPHRRLIQAAPLMLAEPLEARCLLSAALNLPTTLVDASLPAGWQAAPIADPLFFDAPDTYSGSSTPYGLTPNEIRGAYGLGSYTNGNLSNGISFSGVQGDGRGQTIAIVDCYDDPYAASDLNAFSSYFGLPTFGGTGNPTFQKLNQTGGTSLPGTDPNGPYQTTGGSDWEQEESLDIEWAHAMAPLANITLYEASNTGSGLYTAVQTAAKANGVVVVSMSWSGSEFSGETTYDSSYFVTPSGHIGGAASVGGTGLAGNVTFLASTGDSGAYASGTSTITPQYPAASPNVVAVGGTTLSVSGSNPNYAWSSETAWGCGTSSGTNGGGGGGISGYESQPAYQKGVVPSSMSNGNTARSYPDVSTDANPNTGVPIYDSWDFGNSTPWLYGYEGGTSLACPLWAGMVAVADEGRAVAGKGSLDGRNQVLPTLYKLPSADFHDITSGSNGPSPTYVAGTGYDLEGGIGSPVGNLLLPALAAAGQTATTTAVTSSNGAPTYGQSVTFTATITPSSGSGETGTVQFQIDGGNVGSAVTLSGNTATYATSTLTAGSHTIVGVYSGDGNFAGSSGSYAQTVSKTTPTITWATPAAITYGTALSGTQLDGNASVSGNFTYSPAAGTVLHTGNQSLGTTFTPTDSTDYNTVTDSVTLVVNKAVLTVTANNQSRGYGAANPTLTYGFAGFVNSDTSSVVSGTPSLSTTATLTSVPNTYPITITANTLAANDYSFSLVGGNLTVTKAATITAVTSGNSTSSYGQAVTFTATVTPASGSSETGTVLFQIDGGNVGSAIALSGNTAVYTTSSLSAGNHSVDAIYSGDGNFSTSSSPTFTQTVSTSLAWLGNGIAATYNAGNQTLTVTGNATIIGDPSKSGVNLIIYASGNASDLTIDTQVADGGDGDAVVHLVSLSGNGVTTIVSNNSVVVGNFSQSALVNNGVVDINGAGAIAQLTGAGNLTIGNGTSNNTVQLTPAALANSVSNTQTAVTVGSGSTLDITDNTLLLDYGSGSSPLAAVQTAVANGSIISSTANAVGGGKYTVGYADATELATVPSGNVELMYTLAGDARLVSSVTFNDYSVLQNNYNQSGRDWAQGDYNHDGSVNFSDYSLLQNNYNQSVKLTPTLTWATPAAISYGAALSGTQLDATASVAGTFVYSPASGTVLSAGTQALSVTFTPTDTTDYYTATGSVNLTVNTAATTTVVTSTGSVNYGQAVTFTATVTPASGSGETGSVQFQIDGGNVGSAVTLSGNTATYTTATLATGNHSVAAIYSGDSNFATSTSATFAQTISKAATTTAVVSSNGSAMSGQSVTFTATITPTTGSGETGNVTFQIDGGNVSPATLSGNTAIYTTSALAVGNHTIVAIYNGDGNFITSTSPTFTQIIGKATVTYTISINDDGTGHYCAGHYAVYASDTLNNGGLASYDIALGGTKTITHYSPKGNYDDGSGCGTDDEIGFTTLRTANNASPVTASQDTTGYAGGSEVIMVYGFGQTAGNLAADTRAGSTGAAGSTTQAVYGAPVELIKGTFTGSAPTFTNTTTDTGNIFITNSGYGTQAAVLAFTTVTVVSGSIVSQPALVAAVASSSSHQTMSYPSAGTLRLWSIDLNQSDTDADTLGWAKDQIMAYLL